jgi:hypothetical protein
MTKRQIRIVIANGTINEVYDREVRRLIRSRYSPTEEIAILFRGTEEERAEHEAFVDQCKAQVKAELGIQSTAKD